MNHQLENEFEKLCWQSQQTCIGIDEAGRGPIAGPLVVAGVVLPINYQNELIYDSKKCSEKKREKLFDIILKDTLEYKIIVVSEEDIDTYNIYRATQRAMSEIANTLSSRVVLSDAMPLEIDEKEIHPMIKGDQRSISIAAASILAKVTRDRIMMELHEQYPIYQFKQNKGYPTKIHLELIQIHGVTPVHRKSYGPVAKCLQCKLDL